VDFFLSVLAVGLISGLPLLESRVGVAVGVLGFGLDPVLVFFVAVLSNVFVALFLFVFLERVNRFFLRVDVYRRLFERYVLYLRKRMRKYRGVERSTLFVLTAVPFPLTGSYTSVLVAWLSGLNDSKMKFLICCGVVVSALFSVLVSLGLLGGLGFLLYDP